MAYLKILLATLCLAPLARAAELSLEIVDNLGQPVPARVRVRDESGTDHVPPNGLRVPLGKDEWFVTPGSSQLRIPSGQVEVRIERGLEFRPTRQTILCQAGQPSRRPFKLARWIDMRKRGYACGENHLHVPLVELGPQLVAEGLDFGTTMQWWNARRLDVSPVGGLVRSLEFAGKKVPTSVFDYEIEHDWGAVYVIGQQQALAIDNEPDLPNLSIIRRSHDAGALVCYQGGWSREVLLDALLGYVDVVNVCNNNFLRHAYQPRSRYSNLLRVPGFPTYADNPQDMLRMNTETYYRLLNCGLPLAAGAGSATGAKRTPVGYNRAYVRVDEDPTLREFLESWRRGKNFVTNGPMLFLTVNDQYRPGDTIELKNTGDTLAVEITAHFPYPITSLEIVLNGQVVYEAFEPKSGDSIQVPIKVAESAWLAARCTAEDQLLSDAELAAYAWGSKKMPRSSTRLRFAHTSPIYVSLDGKRARVKKSIREAHQMLDAISDFAREESSAATYREVVRSIHEARKNLGE